MVPRIHDLVQDGSQFVIATHLPLLMAYPDACICQCSADGVAPVAAEDTERFRVTRDFLMNPQRLDYPGKLMFQSIFALQIAPP